MSFFLEEEKPFVRKLNSIKEDALNSYKVTLLRFLNEREIELVKMVMKDDVYVYISNQDDELDYKRVLISAFEVEPDFKISILKMNYNKRYLNINHRMVLGALMNMSIERNTIGDILIDENKDCYIFTTKEIKDFLIQEFRILSHQSITLEETDDFNVKIKKNWEIKNFFVQSLRLDLIIEQRLGLSRTKAQEIIKNQDVKVNQKPIDNTSYQVKELDVISVKGYGRIKLIEVGGLSKRDKIFVKIGILRG